jgi:RNA-binding protein YhbY
MCTYTTSISVRGNRGVRDFHNAIDLSESVTPPKKRGKPRDLKREHAIITFFFDERSLKKRGRPRREEFRGVKPKVFIGSASESKSVAEALHENLCAGDFAKVKVWDQIFKPGQHTLEALAEELDRATFGVFVFTEDDLTHIRNQQFTITRDNVLFELGLFAGRLGRDRCFLLIPQQTKGDFHLPTDLTGITAVSYSVPGRDETYTDATRAACTKIRNAITSRACSISDATATAIKSMLQATAKLIAVRAGLNDNEVRAFCHLADTASKHLKPVAFYIGTKPYEDKAVQIPIIEPWYFISAAFTTDAYVCGEVNWKIDKARVEQSTKIWGQIKSVVAAPLRSVDSEPIGTISFDSNKGMDQTGWAEDNTLQDAVCLLAEAISTVVMRTR